MKKVKFRKSGRCEACKRKWRENSLDYFGRHSKNYHAWIEHNQEAQEGSGVELCWYCYRSGTTSSVKAENDFYNECKPETQTQNEDANSGQED